jgi:hypothetical protein
MLIPTPLGVVRRTREGPAMSTVNATHSQFSEVREAARGRLLAILATSFGIVAVTVASAAAAAVVVTVGA